MYTYKYTSKYAYLGIRISVDRVFQVHVHQTYLLNSFTHMRLDTQLSAQNKATKSVAPCSPAPPGTTAGPRLKSRGLQTHSERNAFPFSRQTSSFERSELHLLTESSEESETAHYLLKTCLTSRQLSDQKDFCCFAVVNNKQGGE